MKKSMKNTEFDIKKRTFQFALETLLLCKHIQETDREYILTKQLIRSATSVGANIRESRSAQSKKDFIHKVSIAQKECDETTYWIELLLASTNNYESKLKPLHKESEELMRILSATIIKSKANLNA
jgi:four helix bundle protein